MVVLHGIPTWKRNDEKQKKTKKRHGHTPEQESCISIFSRFECVRSLHQQHSFHNVQSTFALVQKNRKGAGI